MNLQVGAAEGSLGGGTLAGLKWRPGTYLDASLHGYTSVYIYTYVHTHMYMQK